MLLNTFYLFHFYFLKMRYVLKLNLILYKINLVLDILQNDTEQLNTMRQVMPAKDIMLDDFS